MRTNTLEEHVVSQAFLQSAGYSVGAQDAVDISASELTDLGELRLKHMNDSGIDVQVISHVAPTFKPIPTDRQIDIAAGANNQAAQAVAAHPGRAAAFAALPISETEARCENSNERCATSASRAPG